MDVRDCDTIDNDFYGKSIWKIKGTMKKKSLDKLIFSIMKDMDSGRSVSDIADRNGVDTAYVNDVLQIYTTHPGIDVQGIIERLPEVGKGIIWN